MALSVAQYMKLDAVDLADRVHRGDTSPAELLECARARADAVNPDFNAIVYDARKEAAERAAQMSTTAPAQGAAGRLHGLPFLIKDMNAVQGWPRTRGSRLFADDIAERDDRVVQRFREGGLVLMGKTNIPELCLTITTESQLYGPCRNPYDRGHSTGGSSGGGAAAVAAGIVPAAHGTDGGGSIRIPAACCGLVGLKPSRGLTVVDEDMGSAWSGMSTGHVLTRSVRDSAAFLDLLRLREPALFALPAGPEESYYAAMEREPGRLRMAVQREHPAGHPVHPDCLEALDRTVRLCGKAGFTVEEAVPPVDHAALAGAMGTIINVHVAEIISPALPDRDGALDEAPLEEATRRMAANGLRTTATSYLKALDTLKQTERRMQAFHRHYDMVLSPVLSQPPAPLGWLDMNAADIRSYAGRFSRYSGFTALYNATGAPSISLPLHDNGAGLPIGVQFSADWGQDHRLLQLARRLLGTLG